MQAEAIPAARKNFAMRTMKNIAFLLKVIFPVENLPLIELELHLMDYESLHISINKNLHLDALD